MSGAGFMQSEAARRERALLDAARLFARASAALDAREADRAAGDGDDGWAECFRRLHAAGAERASALEGMAAAALGAYGPGERAEAPPPLAEAERAAAEDMAQDARMRPARLLGAADAYRAELRKVRRGDAEYGALRAAERALLIVAGEEGAE